MCHVFDSDAQAPVNDLAPYVLNTNFQNFSLPEEEEIADEGVLAKLLDSSVDSSTDTSNMTIVLIDIAWSKEASLVAILAIYKVRAG